MKLPRHYQVEGIDYLTTPRVKLNSYDMINECCRALLTDSPGSGKTLQSLWAARNVSSKPIVVICPAFLVNQWFNAIAEQYPDASIVSIESRTRADDIKVHADFYVMSVQSLRKEAWFENVQAMYKREQVECTIIDESHYVKTAGAIQSKHVRQLTRPQSCKHVFLLTATPITKEADDLFHQLHIIDPWTFASMADYLNKYCHFEWTSWGPTNVTLKKKSHALLEAQRDPETNQVMNHTGWMLGRTYAQIGLELPPLVEYPPIEHNMPKPRRKAYDEIKFMWFTQVNDGEVTLTANSAMEVMHMLRRLTNSPTKIDSMTAYLDEDPGPYLIGCAYRTAAKEVAQQIKLSHPHLNPIVITGETEAEQRVMMAKQATKPTDVIVATIASLTEGVDLSHCNTVYFYEEDFTPGKHYQFMSRVRRHRDSSNVGVTITEDNQLHIDTDPNERPVILRYFHAHNSIDQRIHAVQNLRSVNIRDLVKVELGA